MTLRGIFPTSADLDYFRPPAVASRRNLARLSMVMAIGGLASACTLETPGVEHPLPDSLASALYPGLTASTEDAPTWVNPEVAPDSLIATFGAREVPEAGIIGRIGMAKLRGDEIFVLDDQLNTVHVLDTRTGSHERVGRRGQGPGELAIPRGMALSEDRIYVADERRLIHEGRRIHSTRNHGRPARLPAGDRWYRVGADPHE